MEWRAAFAHVQDRFPAPHWKQLAPAPKPSRLARGDRHAAQRPRGKTQVVAREQRALVGRIEPDELLGSVLPAGEPTLEVAQRRARRSVVHVHPTPYPLVNLRCCSLTVSERRPRGDVPQHNPRLARAARKGGRCHAWRHHAHYDLFRPLPAVYRSRRGLPRVGRRRHRTHRHDRQLHRHDPWPRPPQGRRCDRPAGRSRHRFCGRQPDRGEAGGAPVRAGAEPRRRAILQLGHRGHDVRDAACPGFHRPAQDRAHGRRLSRHPRLRGGEHPPGAGRSRPAGRPASSARLDLHSPVGARADRRAALQQPRRRRSDHPPGGHRPGGGHPGADHRRRRCDRGVG